MLRITATLVRYQLDDLVQDAHLFRPLRWLRPFLPKPKADVAHLPRGARLRLALIELGPISSSSARFFLRVAIFCRPMSPMNSRYCKIKCRRFLAVRRAK